MSKVSKVTGQQIDHNENKDNVPPSYSAPSDFFKNTLSYFSNKDCSRCAGTGYIGKYKHIVGGRCFQCIPDEAWGKFLGTVYATGINDNNEPVCEIRYLTKDVCDEPGFMVAAVGLPPLGEFDTFDTYDEALEYAKLKYSI